MKLKLKKTDVEFLAESIRYFIVENTQLTESHFHILKANDKTLIESFLNEAKPIEQSAKGVRVLDGIVRVVDKMFMRMYSAAIKKAKEKNDINKIKQIEAIKQEYMELKNQYKQMSKEYGWSKIKSIILGLIKTLKKLSSAAKPLFVIGLATSVAIGAIFYAGMTLMTLAIATGAGAIIIAASVAIINSFAKLDGQYSNVYEDRDVNISSLKSIVQQMLNLAKRLASKSKDPKIKQKNIEKIKNVEDKIKT